MYRHFQMPQPSLHQKARSLLGQPVGISLRNGQGVTGVLCEMHGNEIFVLQYLYQSQFATFHYPFNEIQDIHGFPRCRPSGGGGGGGPLY
jgi:hypothetical protein